MTEPSTENQEKLYNYVKKNFWSIYNRDTSTLSNTCRQLALGEGGICWFIISSKYSPPISPQQINWVLTLLVAFFLFDAAQYLLSSRAWKNLATHYNRQIKAKIITDETQLECPESIAGPANVCFYLKLFILVISSLYLIHLILIRHSC